jgi:hypothetical protein
MTEREILAEKLTDIIANMPNSVDCIVAEAEYIAKQLLWSTVIVPPYKVGTKVYVVTSQTSDNKNFYIFEDTLTHYRIVDGCTIMCFEKHLGVPNWNWNKVFLTKEEAERALKGR